MTYLPTAKPPPRNDYETKGPFTLLRRAEGEFVIIEDMEFDQAIEEFVRYCCPPSPVYLGGAIMDCDGVVAIGWYVNESLDGIEWIGTLKALDVLRTYEIVSPLMIVDVEAGVLK